MNVHFSSPEPRTQASYFHSTSSVVRLSSSLFGVKFSHLQLLWNRLMYNVS